jgi:hypothetical protein
MAMGKLGERARAFWTNRWLVFVGAMWMQSMAGTTYIFGAISPVVKARLGYDQRQVAALGVAKNLGAASASSPARSRRRGRRRRCSPSAPRRTSPATDASGSSSTGRRRRCPFGWYAQPELPTY